MVLLVMATIFIFSSHNTARSEDISDSFAAFFRIEQADENVRVSNQPLWLGFTIRKWAHIAAYLVLAFCMFEALEDRNRRKVFTVVFSYLYAVFDEYHQYRIGRYGRWQDTLIDLLGVFLGLGLALLAPVLLRPLRNRLGLGSRG